MNKEILIGILCLIISLNIKCLHLDKQDDPKLYHRQQGTISNNSFEEYSETDNHAYIQSLSRLINNQLTLLEDSYKKIDLLNNSQMIGDNGEIIKCKNITKQDQINIDSALYHINTDIWELYFQIQKQKNHGVDPKGQTKIYENLKQRKDQIKNKNFIYCPVSFDRNIPQLSSSFQSNFFEEISGNKLITNFSASSNWVYGSLSETEYSYKQYQFILNNNVKQCSKSNPFASKQSCVSCQLDEYFFLDSNQCKKCPDDTIFDLNLHKCILNASTLCKGNQIYNEKTKKCECPLGLSNFNGQKCQACYIPKYWNPDTRKCQSCPKRFYYSIQSQKCEACETDQNSISSFSGCHEECTLAKPFYDGEHCLNCPQVFNNIFQRCQLCPTGLTFNRHKSLCVNQSKQSKQMIECQQGYIYNQQNGQCLLQPKKQPCPLTYIYNPSQKLCECPSFLPHNTGSKCVSCKSFQFWNQSSKACQQCNSSSYFNLTAKQCTQCPADKPILIDNQCGTCPLYLEYNEQERSCINKQHFCPESFIWSSRERMCICPSDRPISTVQGCTLSCPQNQLWSPNLNTCVFPKSNISSINIHICKEAEIWNQQTQQCVCVSDQPYQTQEGCVQCFSPTKWSAIEKKCIYSFKENINTSIRVCPTNFVYNSSQNSCNCPKDSPFNNGTHCMSCYLPMYWSFNQKNCKSCIFGKYFNIINRKCQYCPFEKPFLQNNVCQQCPPKTTYNQVKFTCERLNCFGESSFSFQKNDCVCNISKRPFYDGKNCVSCQTPNRWDITTKNCVSGNISITSNTQYMQVLKPEKQIVSDNVIDAEPIF